MVKGIFTNDEIIRRLNYWGKGNPERKYLFLSGTHYQRRGDSLKNANDCLGTSKSTKCTGALTNMTDRENYCDTKNNVEKSDTIGLRSLGNISKTNKGCCRQSQTRTCKTSPNNKECLIDDAFLKNLDDYVSNQEQKMSIGTSRKSRKQRKCAIQTPKTGPRLPGMISRSPSRGCNNGRTKKTACHNQNCVNTCTRRTCSESSKLSKGACGRKNHVNTYIRRTYSESRKLGTRDNSGASIHADNQTTRLGKESCVVSIIFKNACWSHSHISELKRFLQMSNSTEALNLMVFVREIVRRRRGESNRCDDKLPVGSHNAKSKRKKKTTNHSPIFSDTVDSESVNLKSERQDGYGCRLEGNEFNTKSRDMIPTNTKWEDDFLKNDYNQSKHSPAPYIRDVAEDGHAHDIHPSWSDVINDCKQFLDKSRHSRSLGCKERSFNLKPDSTLKGGRTFLDNNPAMVMSPDDYSGKGDQLVDAIKHSDFLLYRDVTTFPPSSENFVSHLNANRSMASSYESLQFPSKGKGDFDISGSTSIVSQLHYNKNVPLRKGLDSQNDKEISKERSTYKTGSISSDFGGKSIEIVEESKKDKTDQCVKKCEDLVPQKLLDINGNTQILIEKASATIQKIETYMQFMNTQQEEQLQSNETVATTRDQSAFTNDDKRPKINSHVTNNLDIDIPETINSNGVHSTFLGRKLSSCGITLTPPSTTCRESFSSTHALTHLGTKSLSNYPGIVSSNSDDKGIAFETEIKDRYGATTKFDISQCGVSGCGFLGISLYNSESVTTLSNNSSDSCLSVMKLNPLNNKTEDIGANGGEMGTNITHSYSQTTDTNTNSSCMPTSTKCFTHHEAEMTRLKAKKCCAVIKTYNTTSPLPKKQTQHEISECHQRFIST